MGTTTAELLFEQINHSTPNHQLTPEQPTVKHSFLDSGLPGEVFESTEKQEEEQGLDYRASCSSIGQDIFSSERKRTANNSDLLAEKETESHLSAGVMAAVKAFDAQIQQHFISGWQKVEGEVLQSLSECQQHVSSLLRAVHQRRLLLLQRFEKRVVHQLNHLEEKCARLATIETQILVGITDRWREEERRGDSDLRGG
ncbi:synaptonemal complex protein 2-like [Polymixia lowei]